MDRIEITAYRLKPDEWQLARQVQVMSETINAIIDKIKEIEPKNKKEKKQCQK